MFSGGIDSTAMLVKLLVESADELRVHHIRMINREQRELAEQRAVEGILAYCRARYRPFRYSESTLEFRALEAIPIDYISIAFVACQVAIDTPGCNRVAVATLAADTDIVARSARQRRVFDEMYACYRARKLGEPDMDWIYPVHHTPKAQLAGSLPPELLDLTWSCRTPLEGMLPCGSCKACRVRRDLRISAAAAENRT